MTDDSLLFQEDDCTQTAAEQEIGFSGQPWNILIIDDEDEVHKVSHLVLSKIQFDKKPLHFLHAYSAKEAKSIFESRDDIALALVDVVMENDHAGLDLVDWIRKDLRNNRVRLVLRTGQPGQAPEHQVIEEYDINDYKDKTELTDIKMKTLVYAALRSYRDINTIERSRRGLERVITATSTIYQNFSMESFASAVLEQISNLLSIDHDSIYASAVRAMAASHEKNTDHYDVIATTGNIAEIMAKTPGNPIPPDIVKGFDKAMAAKKSMYIDSGFFGYFITKQGNEHLLYVCPGNNLSQIELHLLEIYSNNVAIALENRNLHLDIESTQRELIYRLGEAVEKRSKETGGHVKRVAKISELLAIKFGLDPFYASNIKLASPLHDIGKIGIPDHVLNKPGKFEPEEWETMKTHAHIGYEMLSNSKKPLLNLAATIAKEHHENWDGSGYPYGLSGDAIDIAGRITALADVFDALGSKRCYKDPWPLEQIMSEIQSLSGKKFDPKLVTLLIDNIDEFAEFRNQFPD
jgi:response regulator RpfG family c-di-GMP phosphodiesterase